MTDYVELHNHSFYSLLDGASSPEALVARANEIEMRALALTDHDSLAGAVRFWKSAREIGIHAVIGAEVTLEGDQHLTLLAETQEGYANLCRLITASKLRDTPTDLAMWPGKGEPAASWELLEQHNRGLTVLTGCRQGAVASALLKRQFEDAKVAAARLCDIFGRENVYLELQHHGLHDDDRLVRGLLSLSRSLDLPHVATNDVHYALQDESRLRDALIAIRHNQSLKDAMRDGRLPLNRNYYLASAEEMARRFDEVPDALRNTISIAERSNVSLDFSNQRLPAFPVPHDRSEFEYLYQRCHEALPRRYPQLKPEVLKQLAHELDVIDKAGLAGYFLIVSDVVRFAREQNIRCQGRGSAANSIVTFLLGITNIDPIAHNLLFERFLSADRFTMPDIDVDFAADTREEVLQYVYQKYGTEHVAMVCNTITFRAKSAIRGFGKALGFELSVVDCISKSIDAHSCEQAADTLLQLVTDDVPDHPLRLLSDLVRRAEGVPRHLGIHSGGMLITGLPLNEVVPLERATMPGRIIAQWDKYSVEDGGLVKFDFLALGMLGMISKALSYVENPPDLDALTLDDPRIYQLLCAADTIGAFQVESRAQLNMLPRLKPVCFADIAVIISIIRPGPIQGGAVHPYLRRRAGLEPITYLHPCLEPILSETLGCLLYQEQAVKVGMVAAGFSAGEADFFRRALSRNDEKAIQGHLRERFVQGAIANGIDRDTAEGIFQLLGAFAGYGFCKSHAASFALIAYQSMYLKCYFPAQFYCALVNSQPMGFYSAEVIVNDASRHGIPLLRVDVNHSDWDYKLEETNEGKTALRVGLRAITGLGDRAWERVQVAREEAPFTGLRDFCIRVRLPKTKVSDMIFAGAFDEFGTRRELDWALGAIDYRSEELPLEFTSIAVDLPQLDDLETTEWEYRILGLSVDGHIMRHYRPQLERNGILSIGQVKKQENGRKVRVSGMVVVKQRPATARGILFASIEDQEGLLDLVVKPNIYEQYRKVLRHQMFIVVEGTVQKAEAISVLVTRAFEFQTVARPAPKRQAPVNGVATQPDPIKPQTAGTYANGRIQSGELTFTELTSGETS